jgi:hypothetical protein
LTLDNLAVVGRIVEDADSGEVQGNGNPTYPLSQIAGDLLSPRLANRIEQEPKLQHKWLPER